MNMKNKAEFNIQTFLVGFLIFIGVAVTFGSMAQDMSDKYDYLGGGTVTGDFVARYDQVDEVETVTSNIESKVLSADSGTEDSQTEFLGDVLGSVKLLFPLFGDVLTLVYSAADDIGVPPIWTTITIAVIIIMLITTLIFMVFKSKG